MISNVQIVPKLRECKGMQSKSIIFLFLLYNAGELKKMLKKKKKKKKKKKNSQCHEEPVKPFSPHDLSLLLGKTHLK